jgi:hypothetical protein
MLHGFNLFPSHVTQYIVTMTTIDTAASHHDLSLGPQPPPTVANTAPSNGIIMANCIAAKLPCHAVFGRQLILRSLRPLNIK